MNDDYSVSDGARHSFYAAILIIGLFVVLFIGGALYTTGYYAMLPWWRNAETVGIRNSNEYVSTKQTLLLKLAADVDRLDAEMAALGRDPQNASVVEAKGLQRGATVERMRSEAQMIRSEQIPALVLRYLR